MAQISAHGRHRENRARCQYIAGEIDVGDSDYVEDMTYRTQMVKDSSGNEFVEVRLRLLEDKTDNLAKQLTAVGSTKYGGWELAGPKINVTDLQPGDSIAVKVSGTTGALKPTGGIEPNVSVLEAPKLIGTSAAGRPLYRVQVASTSGLLGEVDIELRETPSIQRSVWDPNKPIVSQGVNAKLTTRAQQDGWTTLFDNVGYKLEGNIMVDETGTKTPGSASKLHGMNGGNRLSRTFESGTQVEVNLVHPATADTKPGTARRSNYNGEVTIRVPVEQEPGLSAEISQALEAVGVPVAAQTPNERALAKMAINKVEKAFSPTFKHRRQTDATGLAGDAGTAQVLSHVDSAIGSRLGRKATLDDFSYRINDDGRIQVIGSVDVAKAITQSQGIKQYKHNLSGGTDQIIEILSGTVNGLMATDTRWSAGIHTSGMSSSIDMSYGSGDRVYMYSSNQSTVPGSGQIIFNPVAINRNLDQYATDGDNYGKRTTNNQWWTRGGGSAQHMYKGKIDPDVIGAVLVQGGQRDTILKELKKRGITHIGGRPVGDVVVSSYGAGALTAIPGWSTAGVDAGVSVPITKTLAAATSEAVADVAAPGGATAGVVI